MLKGVMNESIQQSFDDLFSKILLEQSRFQGVKKAAPEKKDKLDQLLESYALNRGRGFFYPYISTGRGHGPFTEIQDGSIKYDLIGGIGPNLLGHSHPLMIQANLEAATADSIMCGNLLPYSHAKEMAEKLVETVKDSKLKHFWYAGSGSFANDTALKMVWQKMAPKYRLIAFEGAFAGRSIATQDITQNPAYRVDMPRNIDVDYIPHFDSKNPKEALSKTLAALDRIVKKHPDSHCAVMIELVQGEAGFIHGDKNYYHEIAKWTKDHGLFFWVDEIQTFGRTHELFAFQTYKLEDYVDILTIGKALQCCGTLYSEELNPKPGLVSGTFNGSLASIIAGSKTLKFLSEGNFYGPEGRSAKIEKNFFSHFQLLQEKNGKNWVPYYGGIGTMIAFEVGDSSKETTVKFIKALYTNGIIAFMAGANPTRVRFLLPLCLDDEHISEIFKIINQTLNEVLG
ncbi:MAG: aminotransferase class III-fold pyridoxal phosphate-dependent enzyme [Bacteriovoracaceae bacterium]|jgi:4-aminobutyrate aminotransferase-like enzyme|nr:aminotransferase class III-fold pyridoxal phosphate-dependent enzyme [Bacteriovoracaceae bacterium]